jgi:YesN/AraC family two-component response regulator
MEVGYQEPFYFSRIFKKMEGVSPQHYRERGASPGKPE